MRKLILIAGGATAIYFVLAMMMAVIPGYQLSRIPPGPNVKPLTPLEARGRKVFAANGCSYCHTQQVRPLEQDKVFGRPSTAGDFAYETPELLGSERTGPDLSNVGLRRGSDVWQYMHLYNPRSVEPRSIMPSFAWMFEVVDEAPEGVTPVPVPKAYAPAEGVVIPSPQATALVAYLLSRKQAALPSATAAPAPVGTAAPEAAAAGAAPAAGTPADATQAGVTQPANVTRGKALFDDTCAACHQSSGEGVPNAFPPLKGNAVANAADPSQHIQVVLFGLSGRAIDGVSYSSAMPPWAAQFSDQQIADIISYERSAWGNHGQPVTAKDVAAIRAKGAESSRPAAPAATAPATTAAPAATGATLTANGADIAQGKSLFEDNCAACHQSSGEGVPNAFPPLKGNAVANAADPSEHIQVVLFGLSGKAIDGVSYSSAMPPWAAQFSDQQIADIISYERSAWGNHGQPVTAKDVAAIRAKGK